MVILSEKKIGSVSFLASEDYRYVIELHSEGMIQGADTLTGSVTEEVPLDKMDSVISEMNEKFKKDFKTEGTLSNSIKSKADRLKRAGYSCVYDMGESSVTVTAKDGTVVYTAVGKEVDRIIQDFENDPVSLDTALSIEDYCLAKFV